MLFVGATSTLNSCRPTSLHSVWHNVEGDTKTEASRKPVPLHPLVIVELNQWKLATLYHSDDDYLFPSIAKNGSSPCSRT